MFEPIRVLNIFMVLDRGGAETFVMNVYRKIDRTKVQFDFLVHGDKNGAYEKEIQSLGGRIFRLPFMKNYLEYKKAIRVFFAQHQDYQFIHSHASELGLFIFKEAKKRNIPYRICHAHNAPKGFNIKTPIRSFFRKRMNLYSNVFFACSEEAGVWQFGKHREFTVIKNGIDVMAFAFNDEKRQQIREQYDIDDKYVIGHVGRFEKQKNHKFIIEVFEEVTKKVDSILLLIGEGSLKHEIQELVHFKGLDKRVVFLGAKDNVTDYLNAMDTFVFPSLFEGLGIVLIEAQANGLKCFVSETVPKEAFVTDLVSLMSLSQSPSEWARIILSSNTPDREKYNEIVDMSGFNIHNTAEQLQKYYLSCL